ncbi:LysR substrate-binding domain-containing protein [Bordetella genomosp. 9]|uniref:LysR family transcriptional regulator n=1 Tax=Bordetella genomosp. 9 TaxID=1416803 RepID=A0A1W6YVM6_9BORD|nr:LysR substrate-binding domain-containing protein [Bordetella genomosp. 9]ARP85155.1 LysR family transcriptional regulator [Bordetella genomosp. 9]ARP89145.1 LysR family transcriptional regulator [Bordetella genomosp. 9]
MNPRQLLPSMSQLVAFEAAARHESYTRAATELSLTQGAVSRQVQALEATLGARLFQRSGREVALTDVGRLYLRELAPALERIRGATLQALAFQSGHGTLRLATLPTFGSKWLLPRLHRFYAAHPGTLIHLHSRIRPFDFNTSDIDAAIAVGSGDWPDLAAHRLHTEHHVLIGSPDIVTPKFRLTQKGLGEHLLLSVATHPQGWSEWLRHHGLTHRGMRMGPSFELTSHLIQAVMAGIGIGLVPRVLVEEELRLGQLATAGDAVASRRNYYLVYPPRNAALPALTAFRGWLLQEIGPQE